MTHCLDTSAYSFFRRGHRELIDLFQSAPQLSISSIVIGELLGGFKYGNRSWANERDLDGFLASPRVRVLAVDPTTAHRYAEISTHLRRQGRPLPTNDIWIAAHAMQHGLQMVTTDKHFSRMPQVSTLLFEP